MGGVEILGIVSVRISKPQTEHLYTFRPSSVSVASLTIVPLSSLWGCCQTATTSLKLSVEGFRSDLRNFPFHLIRQLSPGSSPSGLFPPLLQTYALQSTNSISFSEISVTQTTCPTYSITSPGRMDAAS